MFGLSFTKLLFTILVIVAVWRAFKLVQQLQDRRADPRGAKRAARRRAAGGPLELEPCPLCGTYVPKHGPRCRTTEDCLFAQSGGPPAPRA